MMSRLTLSNTQTSVKTCLKEGLGYTMLTGSTDMYHLKPSNTLISSYHTTHTFKSIKHSFKEP